MITDGVERQPRTNRYRLTPEGLRVAIFCTRSCNRFLGPTSAQTAPTRNSPDSSTTLEVAIDQRVAAAHLAAA